MAERRYHAPRGCNLRKIDDGCNSPGRIAGFRQNLAPGGDDQRMAISAPTTGMLATLRRREHEGAGLNRPGAQQNMPMRLTRRYGEGGGNADDGGARMGEIAIELREAEV